MHPRSTLYNNSSSVWQPSSQSLSCRETQPQPEKSQPKSQQLKSFIRNIAMPPSPILGKKPTAAVAVSSTSLQAAPRQKLPTVDDSSAAFRKSGKNSGAGEKQVETNPACTGAQGMCVREDPTKVKFENTQSASPRHVAPPRSKDTKVGHVKITY